MLFGLCFALLLTLLCFLCCTQINFHLLAILFWNLSANLLSYFLISCLFNIFTFF